MADSNSMRQPGAALTPDLVRIQLAKGIPVRLRVGGTSMLPLIPPGAVVVIRPLTEGLPRVGSIVAVEISGRIVCHQVTSMAGLGDAQRIHTRGIANRNEDGPSPVDRVLGLVQSIEIGPIRLATEGISYIGWDVFCRMAAPLARLTLSIVSACRSAVQTILRTDQRSEDDRTPRTGMD